MTPETPGPVEQALVAGTRPSTQESLRPWSGVEPGDVFWDEGGGIVGLAIRVATLGSYAHCGTVVEPPNADGFWGTVEAYPGGVKLRHDRDASRVRRVARLWRTEDERRAIVTEALSHVGRRYAYGELLRIALWRLHIPLPFRDDPNTMICSNDVATNLRAGRPNLRLSYEPDQIWPHRLLRDVAMQEWDDRILA